MKRQFFVIVYKTGAGNFYKDGQAVMVHCQHDKIQVMGMNTVGEIFPLPESTAITNNDSPPSVIVVPVGMAPHGTLYPSTTQFADAGFKSVTQIKDRITQDVYYCDTADYNTNVIRCNPVSS